MKTLIPAQAEWGGGRARGRDDQLQIWLRPDLVASIATPQYEMDGVPRYPLLTLASAIFISQVYPT